MGKGLHCRQTKTLLNQTAIMSTISLPCQLLCASASAYAINPTDPSGNYNPLEKYVDGHWVPDPTKAQYLRQYTAVQFIGNPYVVTSGQIEAALVGKTANGIIVAFRGTLPPALNWDSFFDWLQDFMAVPASSVYLPGKVHSGFLFALSLLQDGIKQAIRELDPNGDQPLYITGHSKGGGIAPIAATYLKRAFGFNITQTITFAGPNSGNDEFARAYNNLYPNHVRYENYLDIVPLLPPDPEFVDILEVIPYFPESLKELFNAMKAYDYEPVGTLEYIDCKGVADEYTWSEAELLLPVRMAEIAKELLRGNFAAIVDAHHADCGHRYMSGACEGAVC